MARGRQAKWICKDCGNDFSVQGSLPRYCCVCGSENIGRAPSLELLNAFEEKKAELERICLDLNPTRAVFLSLKSEYDSVISYWKQQRRRGYITAEELKMLAGKYEGYLPTDKK